MDSYFEIDTETNDTLQEGMSNVGHAIELPFPAPVMYVINGEAMLKQVGGAPYFGGWETDADKLLEIAPIWGKSTAPIGFSQSEKVTDAGKSLNVFTSRNILVAPIDMRKSWFKKSENSIERNQDYFPGARQHIQALCYAGEYVEGSKTIVPWGPVVLSAKGYQAKYLHYAFSDWTKNIKATRDRVAPGTPDFCFYLNIGTFGKDRFTKMVGPEGSQSPITPISVKLPEKLDENILKLCFVGKDVAKEMAAMRKDAAEWLSAWGAIASRVPAETKQPAYAGMPDGGDADDDGNIPF
jgi:hypothetical protein